MTTPTTTVEINRGAATLTIDLDAFLRSTGWDEDDGAYQKELVARAAKHLADSLSEEIAVEVRDRINAEVEVIVREHLGAGVQQVTEWGAVQGEPTPLRDLIGKAVEAALRKPETRDGYNTRGATTMVQRVIRAEVETAFKAELQTHVKEAQAAAIAAVRTSAAEVIGETIDRARRGF